MDFTRQLKIFVTVVETGSFARAADMLRMARPGVTKAIGELEKSVGARLLQRTTRRTSLTGEGQALYARATVLLSDVAETQNLFGGTSEHPKGRLRVDIPVALAKPLLIPALPAFCAAYPDIELILGVSDQPVSLVADGVDCVIRIGALPDTSMIARKLASLTMVICASPDYLAERSEPATMETLPGHVAINFFSGRGHRPLTWMVQESATTREISLPSAIMVNDAEAMVACALAGMGLIQVPELLVRTYLEDGRLVKFLPRLIEIEWPMSIMYPNRQYLAPQVRIFIDWMVQLVLSQSSPWLRPA